MSELEKSGSLHPPRRTFTPADMADIAMRRHPETPEPEQKQPEETVGPYEGKTVEINGRIYQYRKSFTDKTMWDSDTQQRVPRPYTLRTWFSHSTDAIGPGPGWDSRLSLPDLSEEEMLERYGHVFTHDEIFNPSGNEDYQSGEVEGGMPDDIPYYELLTLEEIKELEDSSED